MRWTSERRVATSICVRILDVGHLSRAILSAGSVGSCSVRARGPLAPGRGAGEAAAHPRDGAREHGQGPGAAAAPGGTLEGQTQQGFSYSHCGPQHMSGAPIETRILPVVVLSCSTKLRWRNGLGAERDQTHRDREGAPRWLARARSTTGTSRPSAACTRSRSPARRRREGGGVASLKCKKSMSYFFC